MSKHTKSRDFEIAYNLEKEINRFGLTENAVLSEEKYGKDYNPRTLIDQTLELIDPTPNVYTLFVQFNERFFKNVLLPVEVKWSNRMTSCAGTCSFHPRSRQCVITLSAPLLKLRPRKDLVETLLHEMIHGYLFLTNNNRDRDGHGPEFCKHMNRINAAAGTKITIYHSFHEEVRLHQQHWWRCNGPCQKRGPYFGMVRRATNRAPGPNDFWWSEHRQRCDGQFIKVKEPENFKSKNAKTKSKTGSVTQSGGNGISNWLKKPTESKDTIAGAPTHTISKPNLNNAAALIGFKKLGNNANNVHGFGTGGPGSSNVSPGLRTSNVSTTPKFSASGTVGGSNSGISVLLTKFNTPKKPAKFSPPSKDYTKPSQKTLDSWSDSTKNIHTPKQNSSNNSLMIECPVCSNFISNQDIDRHVNSCLDQNNKEQDLSNDKYSKTLSARRVVPGKRKSGTIDTPNKQARLDFSNEDKTKKCPVCNKEIPYKNINSHLDDCLSFDSVSDHNKPTQLNDAINNSSMNDSIISLSDSSDLELTSSSPNCSASSSSKSNDICIIDNGHKCLVCNKYVASGMSLNDHLEDCIGTIFNDELTDCDTKDSADKLPLHDVNKYPCPVCMKLMPDVEMNKHLDMCLKSG